MPSDSPLARIAEDLVRRRLAAPAVFMLEAMKPLSVVCQQTVLVTSPLAKVCGFGSTFGQLSYVLESRQRMEELALEVERLMEEPVKLEMAADGPDDRSPP
jgi:hypothetical protein